ncbi:MAG TPA: hypothetical protein VER03_10975 [Bryobacteraceae bacterium]|nr:hypothetical protein [Bryobacteraceae bacterium]
MKPVITFVLGAVLATAIALFLVKRDPAPEPVARTPVEAAPSPIQPEATPAINEPAPAPAVAPTPAPSRTVAPQRETRTSSSKNDRRPSPTFSSTTTARTPSSPPQPRAPQAAPAQTNNTTSTSVGSQGGPPQTTLHMPPPPDGGGPTMVAEKPAPPPRIPKTVTIPAGTLLSVRVDQRLSSDMIQSGDSFRASLDQPLVVDGAVIAERGARIEGRVAESDAGGRVRGTASMALELVRLNTSDGQRVRLQTEGFTKRAERSTKKDAAKVGIGAGLGAAIGAIAGGGKGAAIGAGIGGAAGTGAVMTSRGEPVEIPAETRLTFRIREPITITEKLN